MLIDVHAHIDRFSDEELFEVIKRAEKEEVIAIITQGVTHENNLKVLELAEKFKIIKPALGLYPLNALNVKVIEGYEKIDYDRNTKYSVDETLEFIKKNRDKIIAIGEVGLDMKFSKDLKTQIKNFEKIIELSEKIKKPLIVHSRGAEKECIELLETSKNKKIIMHMFSGNKKLINRAAQSGFNFSVPVIILKSTHFQMLVENVNINQLFTETDCPWLSPFPEKKSEPSFIKQKKKKI
ncbi:TatD family hydrolase, partial [Candidatus Woesearchaeota archaeon]|nr:TatD family hydrolase [Candidatus Woesearchaeota archaeon]